ncbi:hypothetical protein C1645_822019 [Glomus cerebriforme]|uniref:Uncharacterized protein n=1 Tax=Glomus cerebriforme TaxID=658196 RepID=A0A397SZS0_9GLOM|nr:hypothetical protein C1645_822019 [Glomus cerebriforme]
MKQKIIEFYTNNQDVNGPTSDFKEFAPPIEVDNKYDKYINEILNNIRGKTLTNLYQNILKLELFIQQCYIRNLDFKSIINNEMKNLGFKRSNNIIIKGAM